MTLLRILNVLIDVFGIGGVIFLAIPALHASRYATLAARLSQTKVDYVDDDLRKRSAKILTNLQDLRDSWRPWKANCLKIGTIMAAASYVLSLAVKVAG